MTVVDLASLEIRIARSENLPVLPQAVSQVLRLADDPNATARDIERIIERDPAITAKILRVANSAFYGGNRAATIARAVSFLGLNAIRSLVVSVAFQQMISGPSQSGALDRVEYWRHSLAVATGARILGKIRIPMKAEELYSAGMLHDVGMMIMARFQGADFDAVINTARQSQRPIVELEEEILGYDHSQAGALLAEKWNLSGLLRHAIAYHHDPSQDGDYYETTCVVAAANALAHQCGFTNNQVGVDYEIDQEVSDAIGLPQQQFDVIRDVMVTEVLRAQEAFHIH